MDGHGDIESLRRPAARASHFATLLDPAGADENALAYKYPGNGTPQSPFIVDFLPTDARNPLTFKRPFKWLITWLAAFSTLAVSFASSAYSGGAGYIKAEFGVSSEVVILGVSMFVLGFAIGPLIWAPLSELYGRQRIFFVTYMALTAFNAAAAAAPSMPALIVLRFFAGAFGSSPLTNAGGVIADMFSAEERGLATSVFALAPFLGPALGPIASGFLGQAAGWRWVEGLMAIFSGVLWILNSVICPETYAPFLLRERAAALSRKTGSVYLSKLDAGRPRTSVAAQFKIALSRPWLLLFREPIVLLTALYMAIIYGTLYMCFAAFPIVFQQGRGWAPGIGGLAFCGIAVGMAVALVGSLCDDRRFQKVVARFRGTPPPEARLPPALVGSILLPIGLFWFAWTNGPTVHWVLPIIGSAFFAAGIVLVFLSLMNYLIDSYVIFAASALAANSVLRSLFGAIFPLFTTYMYKGLGTNWASSIPAFLALVCVPFPFLFYRYGAGIRMRCKYAAEAAQISSLVRAKQTQLTEDEATTEADEAEKTASDDAIMALIPPSTPSSASESFYTANDSDASASSSSTAAMAYRETRPLPSELQEHSHVCAANLLNSMLGAGLVGSSPSPPSSLPSSSTNKTQKPKQKRVPVPPPSHLGLLATLTIHPMHTTMAEKPEHVAVATLALGYLRNLLALVGPVNGGFRSAFCFGRKASSRRGRAGPDLDDASGDSEMDDEDELRGSLADEHGVWGRGQDLWSTVGWAFNTAASHPRRWRYWKVWLEFMLDLLDADWEERTRIDFAAHEEAADGKGPITSRAKSMIAMYMDQHDGRQRLRRITKALVADGGILSTSAFPEVFEKEPRGPRKTSKKRKREKIDVHNDKFGDYLDDISVADGGSEPPTPQKPRGVRRDDDVPFGCSSPGLAESVPLRLRFFALLSDAACDLRRRDDLDRLFEDFAAAVRSLPLPLFSLFVSHMNNPLSSEAHTTIARDLFRLLLPAKHKDPRDVDAETDAIGGLSMPILEHCYILWPANTVGPEDNAKLSLVVEYAMQLLWIRDVEYSDSFAEAANKGIKARATKSKSRRTGKAREDAEDDAAREVLNNSAERIRALLELVKGCAE
ncbi:hypothetical protein L249_2162 [Ophiocordyceps polyrhachis-furcata BCC 54312]|uniref:Major facilitator superfamily (MFS) profile domain-containing protein n=1 Tax=Ophiocordyceps polyrhachis-furcata BCC 54312 TaxID=1330021 RepID=A0A367LRW0_9HYPO|nr:hypothetical protein L249_2162 [Ophiocordyceps polyrhachis-furcata BCC 54312]